VKETAGAEDGVLQAKRAACERGLHALIPREAGGLTRCTGPFNSISGATVVIGPHRLSARPTHPTAAAPTHRQGATVQRLLLLSRPTEGKRCCCCCC